jgi:hypothetical protein
MGDAVASLQPSATAPMPSLVAELDRCGWRGLFSAGASAPQLPEALTVAWWHAHKQWLVRRQATGIAAQLSALERELAAIAWIRLEGGSDGIDASIARAVALIDSEGLRRLRSRLRVLRRQALTVAQHYQPSLLTRPTARALERIADTARGLHDHVDATALRHALAQAERQWSNSDAVRRAREMRKLVQGLIERLRSMDLGGASSMSGHIVPAFRAFEQDPGEATRRSLARHMQRYAQDLSTRISRLLELTALPHGSALALNRPAAAGLCRRLTAYADDVSGGFLDDLPPDQVLLKVAELSKLGALAQQLLGTLAADR